MRTFYPLVSAIIANTLAQLLKPIFHYLRTGEKQFGLAVESGGFPSSHTALVVGLTVALAYQEGISSNAFMISSVFSLIVIYDAANVRYYAGQNIALTKQLIKDIEILTQHKLSDPIYLMKLKTVLGHKWVEILGGLVLGISVPSILFIML
ncbi:MAG: divergent PAP2 family protein [Erysipelothrix sp.]|nr:divergent PAP2 family protein [Erysipelothrix sp.]